ncbi:hypothetical protein BN85400030 [Alteracholeplasma palmae J233]|uniref:Uncharacterized protein n=1 Tax=Alteracholeplasma palmae (strain ATCC 49389 / J233) TaxID=1318466 RepID=U4KN39_ALTPJ|nr:hypothetical protein [Alteracholeplasma palmae]CCV63580.1 hypothetical protein BN85400030 [Alteracholeplasma palmae J233]
MSEKEKQLLIFIIMILASQLFLKLWSFISRYVHKTNHKYFENKNGLEEFYYTIYFMIILISLGVIYAFVIINYEIKYYSLFILALSLLVSFLLYKKINPTLTKITSDENCFIQSKRFFGNNKTKIQNTHYFINTFYQFSLIFNTIAALIVYLTL